MNKSFGFIGGGRAARIILKAIGNKANLPENIIVSDLNDNTLDTIKKEFPSVKTTSQNREAAGCDYVFISLHPPVIAQVLEDIKTEISPGTVIISLAPKITIAKISSALNGHKNIVRMIPNAPAYVNDGFNPVTFGPEFQQDEKPQLTELFSKWGKAPETDEVKLEAYAVMTAMGPTYLWYQLRKLQELGLKFGLQENELQDGIQAMASGAVNVYFNAGLPPEEVIDLVPVKPMAEFEEPVKEFYDNALTAMYGKLKN